jgi:hypothetical protein
MVSGGTEFVIDATRQCNCRPIQASAPPDETELKTVIAKLAGQYPTDGYRRITTQLQREGQEINHKRVARLMRGVTGETTPST